MLSVFKWFFTQIRGYSSKERPLPALTHSISILVCLICIIGTVELQAFEHLQAVPDRIDFSKELSTKVETLSKKALDSSGDDTFDFIKFFAFCGLLGLSSQLTNRTSVQQANRRTANPIRDHLGRSPPK